MSLAPRLRTGRSGARPVRGIAAVGDDVGPAGTARTAPPQVSPALAGIGAARTGSPRPVAAAGAFAAQRMDSRLSQPRPGRARHRHRRSARPGPRDPARTGGGGSAAQLTQRSGAPAPEAAWRLLDDPVATRDHARRPAGAVLAAADRAALAAPARSSPGRRAVPDRRCWATTASSASSPTCIRGRAGPAAASSSTSPRLSDTGSRARGCCSCPAYSCGRTWSPSSTQARPALVYPARGIAELWQPTPPAHSDALASLLGRTRAALLESLAEPASTHTLARRHGLAPSTVSEHLTALHNARLITRRRHRHAVIYQQAPLGTELAHGGGPAVIPS